MYDTMRESCLFGTPAWAKVKRGTDKPGEECGIKDEKTGQILYLWRKYQAHHYGNIG